LRRGHLFPQVILWLIRLIYVQIFFKISLIKPQNNNTPRSGKQQDINRQRRKWRQKSSETGPQLLSTNVDRNVATDNVEISSHRRRWQVENQRATSSDTMTESKLPSRTRPYRQERR